MMNHLMFNIKYVLKENQNEDLKYSVRLADNVVCSKLNLQETSY